MNLFPDDDVTELQLLVDQGATLRRALIVSAVVGSSMIFYAGVLLAS
ncbi:MAG: hypothetical protein JWQ36_2901 [Enterovirga sp.]|jgi:hypothetical protein|nr:hypothetical protein [Enterovirga sp.]